MADSPVQLAYAHLEAGRLEQARSALQRALRRDPTDAAACAAMSLVLLRAGEPAQAAHYAGVAARRLPDDFRAQHNLGNILTGLGRHEEALTPLERARALAPREPQVAVALANAHSGLQRPLAAAGVLRAALDGAPEHPKLLNNLGHVLHLTGRIEEGLPLVRRACAMAPADHTFADGLAAMLHYAPGVGGAEQLEAAAAYGRAVRAAFPPLPPGPARPPATDGRLRVGLLSPDLRAHAVAMFAEPIFDHLDRGRFFLAAYNAAAVEDDVSARLRAKADLWRHVGPLETEPLARMIRADRIDVLLDLAGHTLGNRLPALAMRPAPVQVMGIGFPGTTGVQGVDWRLVDSITDPAGFEAFSSERLLRLDPCCNCYRPPENPPPVGPARDGPVTFAAFSSLLKFNGQLARLWARVLLAAPGSRLRLRHSSMVEEDVRRDVVTRIAAHGVDPARIAADPPVATAREVLPAYHDADIALDTAPYTGTTTVCEALLMGVPMVSLVGGTPAGRVAHSLLGAAGLGELCAADEEGYVRLAAALAGDRARLARLRAELRGRLLGSPVCDAAGYGARLGAALERIAAPAF